MASLPSEKNGAVLDSSTRAFCQVRKQQPQESPYASSLAGSVYNMVGGVLSFITPTRARGRGAYSRAGDQED